MFGPAACDVYNSIDVHASTVSVPFNCHQMSSFRGKLITTNTFSAKLIVFALNLKIGQDWSHGLAHLDSVCVTPYISKTFLLCLWHATLSTLQLKNKKNKQRWAPCISAASVSTGTSPSSNLLTIATTWTQGGRKNHPYAINGCNWSLAMIYHVLLNFGFVLKFSFDVIIFNVISKNIDTLQHLLYVSM